MWGATVTGAYFKSSIIASAMGAAVLAAALTASTLTVPDESGHKGNLRAPATPLCDANDCPSDPARLGGYETLVDSDPAHGLTTLIRYRNVD